MWTTIKKSAAASALICLACWGNAVIGGVVGAILFAFALLGICNLKLNLFTGKCGYIIETKEIWSLLIVLVINLMAAWVGGLLISLIKGEPWPVPTTALNLSFFLRSMGCGAIMFIAVESFKRESILGILFGIPLFILSGMVHCIALACTLGMSRTISWALIIAVAGNWLGSLIIWFLTDREEKIYHWEEEE